MTDVSRAGSVIVAMIFVNRMWKICPCLFRYRLGMRPCTLMTVRPSARVDGSDGGGSGADPQTCATEPEGR
jgi:hypothetical protein